MKMKNESIPGAESIVKRINSGKTITPNQPVQAPDDLYTKGTTQNLGGTAPMSRVFNEVK